MGKYLEGIRDWMSIGEAAHCSYSHRIFVTRAFDAGLVSGFLLPGQRGIRRLVPESVKAWLIVNEIPLDRYNAWEQKHQPQEARRIVKGIVDG